MTIHFFSIPHFHPIFFANIALMLGVCASFFGYGLIPLFLLSLFGIALLLIKNDLANKHLLILVPLAFFGGALRYRQQQNHFNEFQLIFAGNTCSLYGTVKKIEKTDNSHFKRQIIITLSRITTTTKTDDYPYVIHLYTNNESELRLDDSIELDNIKIKKNSNAPFSRYLMKEKAVATIFEPTLTYTISYRPAYSFMRLTSEYTTQIYNSLKKKFSEQTFILFSSLFLGKQQKQHPTARVVKEECLQWGISHYLARSGLHLVICIMLWQLLFSFIPCAFWIKNSLLIGIITIYTLFSWSSISFYRALWIFIFAKWGSLSYLPLQGLHSIALISLCTILYNPAQLFFLDFQLSFLLTFALIFHATRRQSHGS